MTSSISKFLVFIGIFLLLGVSELAAQQLFTRVESLVGFKDLRENNGVAVADYDGDNDLDVFVVSVWKDEVGNPSTQSKLFRNNGNGTFSDVTTGSGLEDLLPFDDLGPSYDNFLGLKGYKFGAYWGDYDNDGDPDILFTHLSRVQLFQNKGDGTFTEVTDSSGIIKNNGCENTGAVWFDYNNDSYLDLYVVDWKGCKSNTLYQNNGDGTFTDVTSSTGIETDVDLPGYNPFPYDFNKDGWMDLYVTNDFRESNQLFLNTNGTSFTEAAADYNLDVKFNDMGIAIGDYNKDENFDFYISTIANNVLLTGKADNTFEERAAEMRVKNTGWSWGTKFGDFDLDGDEDLIVVNGFENSPEDEIINLYFENSYTNGNPSFRNTNDQGLGALTVSVEVLDFDYDHDGDLDVFITNGKGHSFFYENGTIGNNGASLSKWFQLSLQGTISNRDAIGTKITLITDRDTFIRYYAGVGFLGQSLKPVHFGLNNATRIQELKIEWPSGHVDIYNNLDLNSFGKAIENSSYEVLNINPAVKIEGCTDPNSCNYNPQATVSDGSCEYAQVSTTISGPTNASYFSTQTYSYQLNQGATISWKVKGGTIISGQGTEEITVQWEFEPNSEVSLVVSDNTCKSEEIILQVKLDTTNMADDKSVARIWNEALLEAIRGDFARPTVHARNLFHVSVAMYDAWAAYSDEALPFLLGNQVHNFVSELQSFTPNEAIETSRKKAISYAAYRLLKHRFKNSPSSEDIEKKLDLLMQQLGYDTNVTLTNYQNGDAAALGNYIAQTLIAFGSQDNSREISDYDNAFYQPVNQPLAPALPGNPNLSNPNRWQSLSLDTFIDQSGNVIQGSTIDFLSPEWGKVTPFALKDADKSTFSRDGNDFYVYHDSMAPPYLGDSNSVLDEAYKKGFAQVSIWSSHLDASDGVLWDVSPKKIGNISSSDFPTSYSDYDTFYKFLEGGDIGEGHALNPATNQPYPSQMVPRGDYTRVLAEFWADGPDSETPPGHWFTILNYVNDHQDFEKKLEGQGQVLDPLEWDVKAYFLLGGAMHDAAISAWSVKGWYDYVRPISAIRYMADRGQSSDSNLPSYHPEGIPLEAGYIELVGSDDPLAIRNPENVGKIKLFTWIGHSNIGDPTTDQAGVGWILAENWWPYQRPSFVTPPFAGYVSGHSTYSRAAAELLTLLTGDAYFPGGMGEFVAKKNEFLVFEEGPSVDVVLQWATYRDASDQCSLSRIWGGIHPPADDIPGRLIGEKVGIDAFNFGKPYFEGRKSLSAGTINNPKKESILYPNPIEKGGPITITNTESENSYWLVDLRGRKISLGHRFDSNSNRTYIDIPVLSSGVYFIKNSENQHWKFVVQ
ncbi:MAG: hypothetical protein CMB99_12335 [Flavobacteriaceae bacterium]|nr:hypothetical protein [Flavobacteriaceae bacterium]|tara:strand:+ start:76697 stop:80749 length:4053 start_codon:yes stop_codon:yes gene_type:complete